MGTPDLNPFEPGWSRIVPSIKEIPMRLDKCIIATFVLLAAFAAFHSVAVSTNLQSVLAQAEQVSK